MSPAVLVSSTIPSRRSTGNQFTHNFEELPLFWAYQDKTPWRAGRVDGQFEVSYDDTGDWFVSDISIAVDNGKIGGEAKGKLMPLNAEEDERIYWTLLDSIQHRYAGFIGEQIADELAARGIKIAA